MINLCLVVIATQFSETKKRETERMWAERQRYSSSATLTSGAGDQPGSCYDEILRYVAHLVRVARRRLLTLWRRRRCFSRRRRRRRRRRRQRRQTVEGADDDDDADPEAVDGHRNHVVSASRRLLRFDTQSPSDTTHCRRDDVRLNGCSKITSAEYLAPSSIIRPISGQLTTFDYTARVVTKDDGVDERKCCCCSAKGGVSRVHCICICLVSFYLNVGCFLWYAIEIC